jgi:hypothetical protein
MLIIDPMHRGRTFSQLVARDVRIQRWVWNELVVNIALCLCPAPFMAAQDLAPRAYIISPVHSNTVTLTWSFFNGGPNFNGTVPITGATGTYSVPIFSYYHSLNFFGRSANITASLPMPWVRSVATCWDRADPYIVRGCSTFPHDSQ